MHFDGNPRLLWESDVVAQIFGGQEEVYYGMTAGTWSVPTHFYFCEADLCAAGAETRVSVGNAYLAEGDPGGEAATASFPVTLSCPSGVPVTSMPSWLKPSTMT